MWGTSLEDVPTTAQMATYFAEIHIQNPLFYDRDWKPAGRIVRDDTEGHGRAEDVHTKESAFGRKDLIAEIQISRKYRNAYFFNDYHYCCFSQEFPNLARYMIGGKAYQESIKEEVAIIKASFPSIYSTLDSHRVLQRIRENRDDRLPARPTASDEFSYG
jgi:hypothetical protein